PVPDRAAAVSRAVASVLGVVLAAALSAGCGLQAEEEPREVLPSDAPLRLLAPPESRPQPAGERRERLYFVREGALVPVARPARVLSPASALQDLLAGPTEADLDRDLSTAVPAGADVRLQRVEPDGTAVVELAEDLADSGRTDQVVALGQLVATLDASPGVRAVRFLRDGEPLEVPDGDGALSAAPVTLADYRALLTAPRTGDGQG
ncbi:MAG: GerMN domain-containing protein, partial [Actinomycetota bacterium]|nr:GerMN domain-containing protein [Actinomycetota bacterium]